MVNSKRILAVAIKSGRVMLLVLSACSSDSHSMLQTNGASSAGAGSSSGLLHIDRSGLHDVGTTTPLDYSNPNFWMCRPDIDQNACHDNLDATQINADGSMTPVPFVAASDPSFDCFYVYPTVLLDGSPTMTDFSDPKIVLDPLLIQAAYFGKVCQVYAPLYRQAGFSNSTSTTMMPNANPNLGVQDVTDALHYYLDHFNHGRKFVIIGHSQGTVVLSAVMKTEVDAKPEVRAKLISALLIGGGFSVASGKTTGGTFQNIPICTEPGQVGCVIAYHSFAKDNPPTDSQVITPPPDGFELACTEPAALAGNTGHYKGSYFQRSPINPTFKGDEPLPPGITTPYVVYRDIFKGQCVTNAGRTYLEITLDLAPGDKRDPPYRFKMGPEAIGLGLHIVDYGLALDDLIDAVSMQAAAALQQ